MRAQPFDVAVVGGAGHIGAPLAILLASKGLRVFVQDIDRAAIAQLAGGEIPFFEEGGQALLRQALDATRIEFSTDVAPIAAASTVIITIGTLIDEFNNPMLADVITCVEGLLPHLNDDQTLVLRSTVVPGVTEYLQGWLHRQGRRTQVAFCPERVVQGYCIRELQTLPQIVSGASPQAEDRVADLFAQIAPKIVRMSPKEAEFAKLFTNTYRYIQFATANQFYMLARTEGLDYARILAGMKEDYPRIRDLPGAGFAAGPCLYKDTVQLAAYANGRFGLGLMAVQINEGLPAFLLDELRRRFALRECTVGLLGMAFKADSDDIRASLSYKFKKILGLESKQVLTCDPFVKNDPELLPVEEVIRRSDVLILCVPHAPFREVDFGNKPVVDIWNFLPSMPT